MKKQHQKKNKHRRSKVPAEGEEQKRNKENKQSTYQNEEEKLETGEGVVNRILHARWRNSNKKETRRDSAKDPIGYSVEDLANDITAEQEYNESSI